MPVPQEARGDVWYVYDGECPLCRTAARALRIREAVGRLHLINAREDIHHPVVQEIKARGIDIDTGTVIKFAGHYYHGGDAMVVMALLGSRAGWFNRMNAHLFRSKSFARLCYPVIRSGRNSLLWLKDVDQIRNLDHPPISNTRIFEPIFGEAWGTLPDVMRKHYDIRPGSADTVTVAGVMTIERAWLARMLSPMLRLCGALVPYSGKDVPVTVRFTSPLGTRAFIFDRTFYFSGHAPYRFRSRLERIQGSDVVEFMRFGFGWRARYAWDGQKVRLHHIGYVWRIFGVLVPMPFKWVIGSGNAWEEPIDENSFCMGMSVVHPCFGQTYGYGGIFRVTGVCGG